MASDCATNDSQVAQAVDEAVDTSVLIDKPEIEACKGKGQ
jgi:hypothetical protein